MASGKRIVRKKWTTCGKLCLSVKMPTAMQNWCFPNSPMKWMLQSSKTSNWRWKTAISTTRLHAWKMHNFASNNQTLCLAQKEDAMACCSKQKKNNHHAQLAQAHQGAGCCCGTHKFPLLGDHDFDMESDDDWCWQNNHKKKSKKNHCCHHHWKCKHASSSSSLWKIVAAKRAVATVTMDHVLCQKSASLARRRQTERNWQRSRTRRCLVMFPKKEVLVAVLLFSLLFMMRKQKQKRQTSSVAMVWSTKIKMMGMNRMMIFASPCTHSPMQLSVEQNTQDK